MAVDTSNVCDLNSWKLELRYVDRSRAQDEQEYLVSLGINERLIRAEGEWTSNPGGPVSMFDSWFDARGGAIVHFNFDKNDADPPPDKIIDVSSELYKYAVQDVSGTNTPDYTNLRIIAHMEVVSGGEDDREALEEIWGAASDADSESKVLTFQSTDDQAFALFGLDNSATVSGLLKHHSVKMGKKQLESLSMYSKDGKVFNI